MGVLKGTLYLRPLNSQKTLPLPSQFTGLLRLEVTHTVYSNII